MALMLVISLLPVGAINASAASYLMPSENVVNLIKQFEGFSASAYWDVNQWTIGYGTPGYAGQTISEAEADQALRSRINTINEKINQFAASQNLYLAQYQHDALISFSYNCGTDWTTQGGRFFEAVVRNASVNEFLFAISLWANVGTTPDSALLNRRMSEANLYLNGVYSKAAPAAYTYTIFNANGGVPGNGGEDKMQGFLSGSNVNILVGNPTKAGSTFGGWFTSPTGGSAVKYLSAATAGATVYAQYGVPASVTSAYASIHSGAGSAFGQIGTLSAGAQIVILETAVNGTQTWGRYADGWINLEYTNYTGGSIQPQTNPTATGNAVVVCNTGVNVRQGPGTGYAIVGSAYNGQQVTVYETAANNTWARVGDNRWISMSYLKMNSGVTPGTNPGTIIWDNGNTPAGSYQIGTVTASALNVRSGAGTNYPIVGKLTKGAQIKIYQQASTGNAFWGKTDAGWVSMAYVAVTSGTPSTPSTPSTPTETVIARAVVNDNIVLTVRSGAGTNAPRVSSLNPGTAVNVYERVNVAGQNWGRIGVNQWICLSYTTLVSGADTPSTPTTPVTPSTGSQTGVVIASTGLNVRAGAGANYARVGALVNGATVTILETTNVNGVTWGRIASGWICMSYVRLNGGGQTPVIPASGTTGRTTTGLNVRAAAGTNNAIVGRLAANTTITIYELTNVNGVSWGRTSNGWVCMNYVTLTGSNVVWH